MKIKALMVAFGISATLFPLSSKAVPNTQIAVECPDVVLWWPSTNGQSFLIQTRPDLNPETAWTDLANHYLSVPGTNRTFFVHANQVPCPQATSLMTAGNSFSINYPSSLVEAILAGQSTYAIKPPPMPPVKVGNEYFPWEKIPGPLQPIMRNIPSQLRDTLLIRISQEMALGLTLEAAQIEAGPSPNNQSENEPEPQNSNDDGNGLSMGFYRVINVTPIAKPDVFGVEQDSSVNQLNILANDYDPNDDPILISSVIPAAHGEIAYSLDGSLFQYTPDPGFYGIDSFSYSITNRHNSWSFGKVVVFVNQSGNTHPTANPPSLTLETNVYSFTLNLLTNAADADNDVLTLFRLSEPHLGIVNSNANGVVQYQRNPSWYGRDAFSFIITDGDLKWV